MLSEYPPGTPPRRHHFPLRNRILAGLCRAVLVVEAAHNSGSLITARWAAEQGQSLFVVPGRIDHPMSRGCTRLLREGAQAVESPTQLLEDLELVTGAPSPTPGPEDRSCPPSTLSSAQERLLHALEGETLTSDELALRMSWDTREVLLQLVELELCSQIRRLPGGLFQLAPSGS